MRIAWEFAVARSAAKSRNERTTLRVSVALCHDPAAREAPAPRFRDRAALANSSIAADRRRNNGRVEAPYPPTLSAYPSKSHRFVAAAREWPSPRDTESVPGAQ